MTKPLPIDDGSVRLYYYTAMPWGLKALWEKRLKVSRYDEGNDPFEFAVVDATKKRSREFWAKRVAKRQDGHGLLCFSDDWRVPQMWSHYGVKHTGMCLGFDVPRAIAEQVIYVDRPFDDPIDHKAKGRADKSLVEAMLRHKFSGWDHEREWRVRVPLGKATDGIHYRRFGDDLHLREVIIGPRCSLAPLDIVDAVTNPPLDVDVFKATTPQSGFAVCRHETVQTHTAPGYRAALALARDLFADELPEDEPDDLG